MSGVRFLGGCYSVFLMSRRSVFALRLASDELWMGTRLHMLARVLLVVLVACGGDAHRGGGGVSDVWWFLVGGGGGGGGDERSDVLFMFGFLRF